MSNAIAYRVADFLKDFEPFNFLSYDELVVIAQSIRVLNLDKNKTLFQINDALHDSFYVVANGIIQLMVVSDAEEILLNKCHAGDIFGLRPFFAKNNYQMTAKAKDDCIVYAIPITVFKPYVSKNQAVLDFLLESFATNSKNQSDKMAKGLITDSIAFSENQSDLLYFQTLSYNRSPLKIGIQTTVKDTAQLITDNLFDSAVITEQGNPVGIVTDKDFRAKVATGRVAISQPITQLMSAPVVTVIENISVAEAQLVMLKHGVTHLCVTYDGTDKSEVKGIISEHDLVVAQANNPGVLLKEIRKSASAKELKSVRDKLTEIIQSSLQRNIPLTHVQSIAGEITLALVKRAVELAILELGSPPARYAWLCIGSQGRKEQLLLTDQDSILIFEDVPADKYRDTKDYFIRLAKKATATLEKVGYKLCAQNHVASNMLWCKSLTDWIKQYNNWMNTPGEKSNEISSVFFDYEMASGEQKIEDALTEVIFKNAKNNVLFYDFLGNDALRKPPPLNFFKKFNIEEEGEFKGKFDLKNRGVLPLVDAARLLTLSNGIKGINSTFQRYKQLAIIDPKHAEIYLNCAEAFLTLSKFSTEEGLKEDSNGHFLILEDMNKVEKEKLKSALAPMRDLEELIKDNYQLTQFS
jgi:CBS domain-containing protein